MAELAGQQAQLQQAEEQSATAQQLAAAQQLAQEAQQVWCKVLNLSGIQQLNRHRPDHQSSHIAPS